VYADSSANVTTEADLEYYARNSTATFQHPAGTYKAGPFEEGGAVDTEFQVYEVNGLRVVDASVFPLLPSTHIQASVYAVAKMIGHSLFILS
jgi:choline dehydrogenase-like flavoprotein